MMMTAIDLNRDPNYSSGRALIADVERQMIEAQHASQARRAALVEEIDQRWVEARQQAAQQLQQAQIEAQGVVQQLQRHEQSQPTVGAQIIDWKAKQSRLQLAVEGHQELVARLQAAYQEAAQRVEQAIDSAFLRHRREAQGKVEALMQTYQGRIAEHDQQRERLAREADQAVSQAQAELRRWL